ncbi:hypothetical protein [Hansschlegelia sp.]|uniref:hypothetical protein n=1 Tax=Hansschlegelia sp. TaxID=2041892 RepID=UPI002C64CACC|nr:hypothetical protein [Hansschlegelia sp.]HVI30444.1 hypothetical protein [Hansschlegelia sp.]
MQDQKDLLDRLKVEQMKLLQSAAAGGRLPTDKTLSKVADLELAIGALENQIYEALNSQQKGNRSPAR